VAADATSTTRMPEPTSAAVLHTAADPGRWAHRLRAVNHPPEAFVADSRRVRLALERAIGGVIGGVFAGPTTTAARLDWELPGAMLDLRDVRGSDQLTAMVTHCGHSWLESQLTRPDGPPRMCSTTSPH
jgi:hypothetical protein